MLQERFTVFGESPSSPSSSGPFPVLLLICISSSRCLPLKRQRRRRSSQFLFQWERGEGKEEALFLLPKKLLLSFIPVFPSTLQRESLHWLFRYRTVHAEGFFLHRFLFASLLHERTHERASQAGNVNAVGWQREEEAEWKIRRGVCLSQKVAS